MSGDQGRRGVTKAIAIILLSTLAGYGAVIAGFIMSPFAAVLCCVGGLLLFFAHSMHGEVERITVIRGAK